MQSVAQPGGGAVDAATGVASIPATAPAAAAPSTLSNDARARDTSRTRERESR
jgi:membrane protease subunit HflK